MYYNQHWRIFARASVSKKNATYISKSNENCDSDVNELI